MRGEALPLSKVISCAVKSVSEARVRLELAEGCFGEGSPQMALLVQMHSSAAMLAWIDLLRAVREDQRLWEAWHAAGGGGHAPHGLLVDTSSRASELEASEDDGSGQAKGAARRWGLRASVRRISVLMRPFGGKKRATERRARETVADAANPASLLLPEADAVAAASVALAVSSVGKAGATQLTELAEVQTTTSSAALEGGAEDGEGRLRLLLKEPLAAAASTGAAGTSAVATRARQRR